MYLCQTVNFWMFSAPFLGSQRWKWLYFSIPASSLPLKLHLDVLWNGIRRAAVYSCVLAHAAPCGSASACCVVCRQPVTLSVRRVPNATQDYGEPLLSASKPWFLFNLPAQIRLFADVTNTWTSTDNSTKKSQTWAIFVVLMILIVSFYVIIYTIC